MLRRFVRFVVRATLVVAVCAAVAIAVRRIRDALSPQLPPGRDPWPPIVRVEPVAERPAPAPVPDIEAGEAVERVEVEPAVDEEPGRWVPPSAPAECPETHPVKAKMSSKLFHLPGMLAYTRTHPDRCYDCEESAVADGFTRAKR